MELAMLSLLLLPANVLQKPQSDQGGQGQPDHNSPGVQGKLPAFESVLLWLTHSCLFLILFVCPKIKTHSLSGEWVSLKNLGLKLNYGEHSPEMPDMPQQQHALRIIFGIWQSFCIGG
ncbi:MAG TPA: hypothetical protein VF532_05250 [Candidatus Angelobacter sp.]